MSLDSKFRDAKPLLTTGLEPQEVAEMFFRSINEDDNDLFLATVTLNMRREGGVPRLGAFSWREWIEGREKHRKYKAEYVFEREQTTEERASFERGFDPTIERFLVFRSKYGAVPGYEEGGDTLDSPVEVHLVLDAGEWRVKEATIQGIPNIMPGAHAHRTANT